MPMLPEQVEINALRKERNFWLNQASDVDVQAEESDYYTAKAELCEHQLAEYDIEFIALESERLALAAALDCVELPF